MWGLRSVVAKENRGGNRVFRTGVDPTNGALSAPKTQRKERAMNWDRVEGNWKQFTGKVKEKWGKLTDDDLTVINGKQDQLVGRIQERYGVAKDEAEKQVKTWAGGL
jgi:uncharacterized protein YjbJ (UPF0337 family)